MAQSNRYKTILESVRAKSPAPKSVDLKSEEETRALAQEFCNFLDVQSWILLEGPLGSGKTTFVRAVLQEIGWKEPVRSPTFNLVQIYPTIPPVAHADLYRIQSNFNEDILELLENRISFI